MNTSKNKNIGRARRIVRFRRAWGETYTKRITTFIIVNAVMWVWCSYILAWFGRYEIAQSLSITAVTSILGVVATNGIKSTAENISKNGYVGKIIKAASRKGKFSEIGKEDKAA